METGTGGSKRGKPNVHVQTCWMDSRMFVYNGERGFAMAWARLLDRIRLAYLASNFLFFLFSTRHLRRGFAEGKKKNKTDIESVASLMAMRIKDIRQSISALHYGTFHVSPC